MNRKTIDISYVIVNHNSLELVENLLRSILSVKAGFGFELIIIDNHSSDNSVQIIRTKYTQVRLIENQENKGFGYACNQGMKISHGKFVFLLNSDTELLPETLPHIHEYILDTTYDPSIGIFGFRLINQDGTLQYSFGKFPGLLSTALDFFKVPEKRKVQVTGYQHAHEVDWVTGACMMIDRRTIEEVGYFDENFFMYYEETDYCLRAKRQGWKIFFQPAVTVIHKHPHAKKRTSVPLKIATEIRLSHLYFFRKNKSYISFVLLFYATMFILYIKYLKKKILLRQKDEDTQSIILSVKQRYKQLRSKNWIHLQ
jgi:GT2 family glycosyltransferase